MNKIGIGIITCNRHDYFSKCLESLNGAKYSELVVVNDGEPHEHLQELEDSGAITKYIQNENNLGVGKSKNKAIKHLMDAGCEYFFIIEDDIIIKRLDVFEEYIKASEISGIQHFNYGPGSPFNREQTVKNIDLHNRHLLNQHSKPKPKMIVDYKDVKISLYEHTVAMFSFFTRKALTEIGLIDEEYYNAWEHVDHTYRIIKAGYHPPFWWFADIYESEKYITEAPNAIDNSSIANNKEQWEKNVYGGREIYLKKHGHYPNNPPYISNEEVIEKLKKIKNYAINQ